MSNSFTVVAFFFFSDGDDNRFDMSSSSTPASAIFPSASLGVAAAKNDECSKSTDEIKLEKVIINFDKCR